MSLRWGSFETSALKVLPATGSRVTLFPSQSTPSVAEGVGGGSVAGRSRRFQDPGIGRGRASTPKPSTIASATPSLATFSSEGEEEEGRRGGEARTRYNDAGRCCAVFLARQVDMSLTCANVGCWLEEEKGVKAWRTRETPCARLPRFQWRLFRVVSGK